jgi:predicted PurR-regulated permease PerM
VGLFILNVPYALPLAVVAGILELVPIIGPIISSIPAIIVALVSSPILGVGVAAYFLIIQQVENSILVPKVMEKAVGLSPILVILVLLIGGSLMGIVGALLAVPVAAAAKVIYDDYKENGNLA